jgi:hypothetical protein
MKSIEETLGEIDLSIKDQEVEIESLRQCQNKEGLLRMLGSRNALRSLKEWILEAERPTSLAPD